MAAMDTPPAQDADPALGVDPHLPIDPTAPAAGPTGRRILFVDDDAYMHVGVRAALKELHCEVVSASTGHEALESAATFRPDVAILDVGLPDTDGYQLAYELRSDPERAGMPIVFLTGHLPDQTAVEVIGGNLFLGKPYRMQVLFNAVQRQLAASTSSGSAATGG